MRSMVAETAVAPRQLVLPLFVAEGLSEPRPISSMPGVARVSFSTTSQSSSFSKTLRKPIFSTDRA